MSIHDESHGFDDTPAAPPSALARAPLALPSVENATSTRERLWDAGYRPVAVHNPIASDPRSGKAPLGHAWRASALRDPPFVTTAPAVSHAVNTGILCDGLRAIDIDIDDPATVATIRGRAFDILGETITRMRDSGPRCLLLYRAALGAPGKITQPATDGKIEVLGAGQQFVAFGTHWTGAPLRWFPIAPDTMPVSALPAVTEEQVHAFLTAVAPLQGTHPQTPLPKPPPQPRKVNGGPTASGDGHQQAAPARTLGAALADTKHDGREQYMRDWVWARIVDWHRECPIPPTAVESDDAMAAAFLRWIDHVESRIPGPPETKAERLEQEGRGWSEFTAKWRYAMAKWSEAVADAARQPRAEPRHFPSSTPSAPSADDDDWESGPGTSHQGPPHPAPGLRPPPEPRTLLSKRAFLDTFKIPDYIVDGILQRGRLISLTSPTGHGKTAVALYLGEMIATGRNIGPLAVEEGEVIFLAGENPDDLCGRMHAAVQHYGTSPDCKNLIVLPGNFPMTMADATALREQIDNRPRAASLTPVPLSLIVLDTSAAYFPGDDENHNVQMGNWARILRTLTQCRGNPAVLVLCHPTKNASRDALLPRGGGAFMAEIDANLTLWSEVLGESTQLHWSGKIRGADFSPINFALVPVRMIDRTDHRGRPIMSIVATLQSDAEAERVEASALSDENIVLNLLHQYPGITVRTIAERSGWVNATGSLNIGKVQRLLKSLAKEKLVRVYRKKWVITDAGEGAIGQG